MFCSLRRLFAVWHMLSCGITLLKALAVLNTQLENGEVTEEEFTKRKTEILNEL